MTYIKREREVDLPVPQVEPIEDPIEVPDWPTKEPAEEPIEVPNWPAPVTVPKER